MCNIKDNIKSALSVPLDMDISASKTCVRPRCQILSVPRTKIRKKPTGKGKENDVWRKIWGDMNGLQVLFFLFLTERDGSSGRCGVVTPPHAVIMFYGRRRVWETEARCRKDGLCEKG